VDLEEGIFCRQGADQLQKELIRQVLDGRADALEALKNQVDPITRPRLLIRGASEDEVNEVLAAIWASVIPDNTGKSLLTTFKGRGNLAAWFSTVAWHRWLDWKRKDQVRARWVQAEQSNEDLSGAAEPFIAETVILALLQHSLKRAFEQCDAESLVLLRLVHLHGLSQRQLAAIWGMPEYALSRRLRRAMDQISRATLEEIRQTDPWLDLKWEDFLELCGHFSSEAVANLPALNVYKENAG